MAPAWRALPLLLLVLLVPACAAPQEREAAADAADDGTRLAAVSVLIGWRVDDFETWKAGFDAAAGDRAGASCLGHYLKRGIDTPDTVYAYCLATDAEALRAYLADPRLGATEVTLMRPMSRDLVPQRRLPGIIAFHEVEDYDTWRAVYDEVDGFRRRSGIVGHAVSRAYDDPSRVVVYHQAESVAALRAFVDSAELREAMRRGGVVGEPDIRFIEVVDFATYQ